MRLHDWRKQAGLNQQQVGSMLGVSGAAIGRYEAGARMPDREIMARIVVSTDGAVTPNDFYQPERTEGGMAEAQAEFNAASQTRAHPMIGAMKGLARIEEDFDLTQPAMPEWADEIDNRFHSERE